MFLTESAIWTIAAYAFVLGGICGIIFAIVVDAIAGWVSFSLVVRLMRRVKAACYALDPVLGPYVLLAVRLHRQRKARVKHIVPAWVWRVRR